MPDGKRRRTVSDVVTPEDISAWTPLLADPMYLMPWEQSPRPSRTTAGWETLPNAPPQMPWDIGAQPSTEMAKGKKVKDIRDYLVRMGMPREDVDLIPDADLELDWKYILSDWRSVQKEQRAEQSKQAQEQAKVYQAIANQFQEAGRAWQQGQRTQGNIPQVGESIPDWQARSRGESRPSQYPGAMPGGDVSKGLSMTPWGVMAAPGERALAGPESQYAGQTYVAPSVDKTKMSGGGGQQMAMNPWEYEQLANRQASQYGRFEDIRQEVLNTIQPSNWIIRARAQKATNPMTRGVQWGNAYGGQSADESAKSVIMNTPVSNSQIPQEVKNMLERPVWGAPVQIPSAPAWGDTPENTKQMLYPYMTEATGQSPVDYLSYIRNMLPENPSRGTAWTPARQRR